MESLALQDCLKSGIDPDIIRLNFKDISGLDLFEAINPNPKRLNAGKLNAAEQKLFYKCVGWDGFTPGSFGWVCNGRVRILSGPLLDPDSKGKINKYRNPKGGTAPITFLRVTLQIWEKVAGRHGVTMPENITIADDGEALGFWEWVIKTKLPVKPAEGEKKAGCLLTLGYVAVSIPGIYNGYRKKDEDHRGKTIARELHPDLLPFDDGREITICFDYRRGDYFKSPEWVNAAILGRLFKNSLVKIARLPGPEKGIDDFVIVGGDVTKVLAAAETVKELQDECLWRSSRGFSPDKVVNQRFLDLEAPEKGTITAIKSGLGTGKTQYLADKVATQSGKQINIGCRNSLLLQMSQRLGSYHLNEHNGHEMVNDPNARISLCWDSLLRLPINTFKDARLIFDEASSSLKHLLSSKTCRDNRLNILDHLKAIAPYVSEITALDGNLKDSDIAFFEEIFKRPSVKIENQFMGDTPPVFFLVSDKDRMTKSQLEYFAKEILNSRCPVIPTDSLRDAEALDKILRDNGRQGLLLSSKTATEDWAKDFLTNADQFIRQNKPDYLIYTPTAENGLDISIKERLDNVEVSGKYFSDCFCWFRGVLGVDECLQISRRVRHPERIIICCPTRKLDLKNGGDFPSQVLDTIAEQVNAEASLLSPESVEKITEQFSTPEMRLWAKNRTKDNLESRNLQRFLIKSFEDKGFEVRRVPFSELKDCDDYHQAKIFCKETESKEIFYADDITLTEALEIERNYTASWPDRCKALKAKLKARLPGIENTKLWTWEFIYRVRFTDRDLLNQLEANWKFENPADAELLQRQKWNREFRTFLPDLSNHWLKLKVLDKLGINKFLNPAAVWTNESPEVLELLKQCRKKSVANLLGHPGKSTPIQYLNRLLKIIGVQLIGKQVRRNADCLIGSVSKTGEIVIKSGGDRVWEYRYQVEGKKSSRPENWEELYPLVSQKMTERVHAIKMSETLTATDSEVVMPPPKNIQNTAEAVTEKSNTPISNLWRVGRELSYIAARVSEGALQTAKNCLDQAVKVFGIEKVFDALDLLPEHQRLAIEGLG